MIFGSVFSKYFNFTLYYTFGVIYVIVVYIFVYQMTLSFVFLFIITCSHIMFKFWIRFWLCRRGYAAASQGAVSSTGAVRNNVMMKKVAEESNKTTSWVPDPVTGYYRPESHVKEIDAAELRNMLLKYKPRQN